MSYLVVNIPTQDGRNVVWKLGERKGEEKGGEEKRERRGKERRGEERRGEERKGEERRGEERRGGGWRRKKGDAKLVKLKDN